MCDWPARHICTGEPASGFNVTLHTPLLPSALFNGAAENFFAALESSAGAFRFEDAVATVDSVVKNGSAFESTCCQAVAGFKQSSLVSLLQSVSRCHTFHILHYSWTAMPTRQAIQLALGKQVAGSINKSLERVRWHPTLMQFLTLLSNSWQLRTRYVLHLDIDAVVLRHYSATLSSHRASSPVEDFIASSTVALQGDRRRLMVFTHKCRTNRACPQTCPRLRPQPSSRVRLLLHAHGGNHNGVSSETKQRYINARGASPQTESFVYDVERLQAALVGARSLSAHLGPDRQLVVERASVASIEEILSRWFIRTASDHAYIYLPSYPSATQNYGLNDQPRTHLCHDVVGNLAPVVKARESRKDLVLWDAAMGQGGTVSVTVCCDDDEASALRHFAHSMPTATARALRAAFVRHDAWRNQLNCTLGKCRCKCPEVPVPPPVHCTSL